MKGAGAKFAVALLWLRRVHWQRFVGARFLGSALAATVAVQLIAFPAYAPVGAAAVNAGDHAPYVGFSAALREAYDALARAEHAALSEDFSFIVNRPKNEPGFRLERQESDSRNVRYTTTSYAVAERSEGQRYSS